MTLLGGKRPPATWNAPFVQVMKRREVPADLPGPAERLAVDLINAVRGEVRFDAGSRALYSTDASNYRQLPIGVVLPRDKDDVIAAVAVCREHDVPIVSRGGGTSLAGQTCNVAVVLDHSKYHNQLLELNAEERFARVQPGIVLDELQNAAAPHGLAFGPDPATHSHCTLGGMIGNNSCGVHSVMAGKTDDNVLELEVLTYRGERLWLGPTDDGELAEICARDDQRARIYRALRDLRDAQADEIRARFPDIPRRVSGYDLPQLLPERGFNVARAVVGSESTLVTVLEAKVRLVERPPGRTLVAIGYPDVFTAADDVPQVMTSGCIACEGMDDKLVNDAKARGIHPEAMPLLPEGRGFLLVEFGGADRRESDETAKAFMADLRNRHPDAKTKVYDDPKDEEKLWRVREAGLGATAMVPGKPTSGPGWEDSAVPPDRLGDYLREIRKLWDRFGYDADMYGHFGQGILHCRINFDLTTSHGLADFRRYMDEASDLVVSMGGSLSGEHGDGQARAEVLPRMFGDSMVRVFEQFKDIWDPDGKMNPGKIVRANPILSDLRLGTDYDPPHPRTWFAYPEDNDSFGHAAYRCVGVGECRRHDGGVMCPSYLATREERHSTRGRARLLFELLNGGELRGGWRNKEVEEALDLCLACKGCKGECPVNVDMATYKAEFRAHHYRRRLRPRAAYSMGLIRWWADLAARAPRVANLLAHAPLLGDLGKRVGGIARQREVPRFATRTFRQRWADAGGRWAEETGVAGNASVDGKRPDADHPRGRVILWADTFNDHFHPQVLEAAAALLADAGFDVVVPREGLCCGRPLYDWGFLAQAKHLMHRTIRSLRDDIRAGTPVVGLEPSCVSVFTDEGPLLVHKELDAQRLAQQTHTVTEFLASLDGYEPPHVGGRALVHGHCHDKSVLHFDQELELLRRAGIELEVPDEGCCGMAGAFGFEAGDHYEVSLAVGERALLPAVRASDAGTPVLTGGFSCREQVRQQTDRAPIHPVELLASAITDARPAVTEAGTARDL